MSSNKVFVNMVIKSKLLYGFKMIFYLSLISVLISCESCNGSNNKYHDGEPLIIKKEYSLIPGICMYTYEGYGKKETFEDKCDKYSVGDKLGNNIHPTKKDTIK